jgi:hypothetical protein
LQKLVFEKYDFDLGKKFMDINLASNFRGGVFYSDKMWGRPVKNIWIDCLSWLWLLGD